jgi:hypothetical protein
MKRVLPFASIALLSAGLLVAQACSDQTVDTPDAPDSSTTTRDGSTGGGEGQDGGSTTRRDAATDPDTGAGPCTFVPAPPVEDGGGLCGTVGFGKPAAPFGPVDAGDTGPYRGGVLPPGIYDAVIAERNAGNGGSFRETLVVSPNGRFTRIRQLDTNSGGGAGPESRRSGTYAYSDAGVTFTYDCATNNGGYIDAGSDTFPYEFVGDACGKGVYRFGLSNLRFTLERR